MNKNQNNTQLLCYYFTEKEREHLLNEVAKENGLTVTKVTQKKDLAMLTDFGQSNLSHVSSFVFDLHAFRDDEAGIVTMIKSVISLYGSKIILIATQRTEPAILKELIGKGIHNIVIEGDPRLNMATQLTRCFKAGMSQEEAEALLAGIGRQPTGQPGEVVPLNKHLEAGPSAADRTEKPRGPAVPTYTATAPTTALHTAQPPFVYTEPLTAAAQRLPRRLRKKTKRKQEKQTTVAIAGICPRMGVTHHALLIASFLKSVGFKVCVLEANNHRAFEKVSEKYEVDYAEPGCIVYKGLDLYWGYIYGAVAAKGYDFLIFDFGAFYEVPAETVLTKDTKILIGGAQAWELDGYLALPEWYNAFKALNFILNFVSPAEKADMIELLKPYKGRVFFSDYAPNCFDANANLDVYAKIFSDYVEYAESKEEKSSDPPPLSLPQRLEKDGIIGTLTKSLKHGG